MKGKAFIEPQFRATVEERKTQFREVMNCRKKNCRWHSLSRTNNCDNPLTIVKCLHIEPRYKVGERMYLKEPYIFRKHGIIYQNDKMIYQNVKGVWKNNMPTKYARYFIEITGVKAERLQDISDCLQEGIYEERPEYYDLPKNSKPNYYHYGVEWYNTPQEAYAALINSINGKGTWERNPWVWVYDYKLIK